jgi:diaminopimelate decarboxylase
MLDLRKAYRHETGDHLAEVDLGGGFGVQYVPGDEELNLPQLLEMIAALVARESVGVPLPQITFEPGRWLIAPCMSTVYHVGTIKDVELDGGVTRRYVSVDGGMSDNIRPVLYDAEYTAIPVLQWNEAPKGAVNCRIVGKHCESGDILVREIDLPGNLKRGDLLIIPITGAYSYSMASNYNLALKPAVVSLSGDLLIPRQTWQEVVK